MKKTTLFDSHIQPCCSYCAIGHLGNDKKMIYCPKKGVVSPFYHCKKFTYDPIRRIPMRQPKLPSFSKEDFSL